VTKDDLPDSAVRKRQKRVVAAICDKAEEAAVVDKSYHSLAATDRERLQGQGASD
jgi:hypothetical protein